MNTIVALVRGGNVHGKDVFKSKRISAILKGMVECEVETIGAAGTFVIRSKESKTVIQSALEKSMEMCLKHPLEIIFRSAKEIRDLVNSRPFTRSTNRLPTRNELSEGRLLDRTQKTAVTFFNHSLSKDSRKLPAWRGNYVKIIAVGERDVLSVWLRNKKKQSFGYPNTRIELFFGRKYLATTRSWTIVEKIARTLSI